jgi:hypothetical protein
MAKDDRERRLRRLEPFGRAQPAGDHRPIAVAGPGERRGVVAQHMEDPEDLGRPQDMAGQLAMAAPEQGGTGFDIAPDIGFAKGAPIDEFEHQDARLVMDDAGRQSGGMGGAARQGFSLSRNMMEREIVTQPGDGLPAALIGDAEAHIAEAAFQRLQGDRAMPAGQRSDAPFGSVAQANPPGRCASVGARQ